MFRLLKSGLPKDPIYPADLKELGYFISDEDEIRSITNPRAYFNFFFTKNDRHNTVQREAMNSCLRDEILYRLHKLGLDTVCLPLGTAETEPHIPILVTSNISDKKRVIILFYEHTQDLGVFAYRVVGGRGGINKGSAVDFVKHVQSLSGLDNGDSPGIILANVGQLRWWRRGKKAVTHTTWFSLPQESAVSGPHRFDAMKNTVPSNRNTAEHVAYVFDQVVKELLDPEAMLEVIGVSAGAIEVVDFLNKPHNWESLRSRMTALALVSTYHQRSDISNPEFAAWLRKRGRAYIISSKAASTAIAGPDGNTYTHSLDNTPVTFECYGCPVYSLGEPYYSEMMLPKGYKIVLGWFQEVLAGGEGYENPEVVIAKVIQEEDEKAVEEVKGVEISSEETQAGKVIDGEVGGAEKSEVDEPKEIEESNIHHLNIQEPEKAESESRERVEDEIMQEETAADAAIKEGKVGKDALDNNASKGAEEEETTPDEGIKEKLKERGLVIHFGAPGTDTEQ